MDSMAVLFHSPWPAGKCIKGMDKLHLQCSSCRCRWYSDDFKGTISASKLDGKMSFKKHECNFGSSEYAILVVLERLAIFCLL